MLTFRGGFTKKQTDLFHQPFKINFKGIAMHILGPIVKNIKESSYYSIKADETTDITNKE